jgi:mRNA interferase RelE/StbE
MSYSIEYEPEAIASLEKLSATNRKRIITKINWLAGNFEQIKPQPLTANLSGFYKLRIGDYRVIYEFNTEESILFIDKVGHRSEIYDE